METQIQTLETLSERIRRLERQNQRLKQAGILMLLAIGSVFLMAQVKATKAPPVKAAKALEAGKFILQDGRGKRRAELGLFADRPALVFYDDADNATLSLGVEPEGAGLTLYDRNAQKAAGLNYTSSGPVMTLYDAGRKRLNLSVTGQGPAVGLLGKNSEAKAALGLTVEDNPFLHLFGARERGGAQLLATPDRTVLRFFDASERARAVLGIVDKDSAPGLVLNDSAGVARAILMLTAEAPGMEFFDQNRVRTWYAR
ncbi:MAG: hypothetical protein LAP85_09685 [Acidobacteriia bacterium]|nr:hypothetical protein [Terriglobia bacterium]